MNRLINPSLDNEVDRCRSLPSFCLFSSIDHSIGLALAALCVVFFSSNSDVVRQRTLIDDEEGIPA